VIFLPQKVLTNFLLFPVSPPGGSWPFSPLQNVFNSFSLSLTGQSLVWNLSQSCRDFFWMFFICFFIACSAYDFSFGCLVKWATRNFLFLSPVFYLYSPPFHRCWSHFSIVDFSFWGFFCFSFPLLLLCKVEAVLLFSPRILGVSSFFFQAYKFCSTPVCVGCRVLASPI